MNQGNYDLNTIPLYKVGLAGAVGGVFSDIIACPVEHI
jgi:hypothetical protein